MTRAMEQNRTGCPSPARARGDADHLLSGLRGYMQTAKEAALAIKGHGIATIKEPRLILSRKCYLFLLSHTRCYTTVLGHILGGHDEITGSCELHKPYRKRRDLLRLRYMSYYMHNKKIKSKYIFDKILQDSNAISAEILNRRDVKIMFSLRDPAEAIPSEIRACIRYSEYDKNYLFRYSDLERICEYYVARLRTLEGYCLALDGKRALYFDGEDVVNQTDSLFAFLKRELGLSRDLSEHYPTYDHTGRWTFGDTSERITSGRLERRASDLRDIEVPEDIILQAREAYVRCRSLLRGRCICS